MRERFFDCISDFIFVEDALQRADVIFVPGGNYPDCAWKAAALYLEGYAPFILPSGRFSKLTGVFHDPGQKGRKTEWEYLRDLLTERGVPEEAILKEDQATFTWENAIFSRRTLEAMQIDVKRAILVCQTFHGRRCRMYYQQQFPEVELLVCPVETHGINRENWYLDQEKIDVVLGEVERCGSQFHEILKAQADVLTRK